MKSEYTNSKKEQGDQDSSFKGVQNVQESIVNKIIELKLSGKSDRAVAKVAGVAHSTVNKYFHEYLEAGQEQSIKHLENTRFQQWLRFDRVIEQVIEQFERKDFKATQWATILTRLLAEQSKLYGFNTGNVNINLDQRQQREGGYWITEEEGEDARTELTKRWLNHVDSTIRSILCLLLLGEEYGHLPHQEELLNEIVPPKE